MYNSKSLFDIPEALFAELRAPDFVDRTMTFRTTGGDHTTSVAPAKEVSPRGHMTLAYTSYQCHYGCHHRKMFFVFGFPVRLEQLSPKYEGYPIQARLEIASHADNPPYEPDDAEWIDGRGYWVGEFLDVDYGFNRPASIVSQNDDWEFGFMLRVQTRAHELARLAVSRGHWQHEWNPRGNFTKKWTVPLE